MPSGRKGWSIDGGADRRSGVGFGVGGVYGDRDRGGFDTLHSDSSLSPSPYHLPPPDHELGRNSQYTSADGSGYGRESGYYPSSQIVDDYLDTPTAPHGEGVAPGIVVTPTSADPFQTPRGPGSIRSTGTATTTNRGFRAVNPDEDGNPWSRDSKRGDVGGAGSRPVSERPLFQHQDAGAVEEIPPAYPGPGGPDGPSGSGPPSGR